MFKLTFKLSAITLLAALIAIPATNYAFLYGSWWAAYFIHFALFEAAALLVYAITISEISEKKGDI